MKAHKNAPKIIVTQLKNARVILFNLIGHLFSDIKDKKYPINFGPSICKNGLNVDEMIIKKNYELIKSNHQQVIAPRSPIRTSLIRNYMYMTLYKFSELDNLIG